MTKALLKTYPFLDPARVGIWGWSYGGYATLMALAQDVENVFKCGISVAPPTNWLFYDTLYTERYMRLPTATDNLVGYENGSILNKVEQLRGKNFMINHGVAGKQYFHFPSKKAVFQRFILLIIQTTCFSDDNVHYQHSMMLIRALEKADIQFIQNSYPGEYY